MSTKESETGNLDEGPRTTEAGPDTTTEADTATVDTATATDQAAADPLVDPLGTKPSSNPRNQTLWMGELEYWMDESFLHSLLTTQYNIYPRSIKLIRDKFSGYSLGYCFIHFDNHDTPAHILNQLNNTIIPGTQTKFKLNWATGGSHSHSHSLLSPSSSTSHHSFNNHLPEFSVFVGDLGMDVTDALLLELFQNHYPNSVKSAKVVLDKTKGTSKGYGFVRFTSQTDHQRALLEMPGKLCGSRAIRVSLATPKHRPLPVYQPFMYPPAYPETSTIFVGGLPASVTEQDLHQCFCGFGEIAYVRIPPGMGCGFVAFVWRQSAEAALAIPGMVVGGANVRLGWGNSGYAVQPTMIPQHYGEDGDDITLKVTSPEQQHVQGDELQQDEENDE